MVPTSLRSGREGFGGGDGGGATATTAGAAGAGGGGRRDDEKSGRSRVLCNKLSGTAQSALPCAIAGTAAAGMDGVAGAGRGVGVTGRVAVGLGSTGGRTSSGMPGSRSSSNNGGPNDAFAAEAWLIGNIAPGSSIRVMSRPMARPDRKRGIRKGRSR